MKTGVELISAERKRQVEQEGWTKEHDAKHANSELAQAAACYAMPEWDRKYISTGLGPRPILWPWYIEWWKPTPNDRIRELVKAGALIAAEIDRLLAEK